MKITTYLAIVFSAVLFLTSCGNQQANLKNVEASLPAVNEADVLYNFLKLSGNYINSDAMPTMITADEVFENLGNKAFHVIDMRTPDLYEAGHINGAINVQQEGIYEYLKNTIDASKYEKVVLVCKSGQSASYVGSVMQLLGYQNVYAMKRGMSGWNKQFADEVWIKNSGSAFADKLETTPNEKGKKYDYPAIKTGKRAGIDILDALAADVLKKTANDWGLKAEEVFANPSSYYIINYWVEEQYNAGHIPTAIQYTPKKSLSRSTSLATIPTDKKVVVYCYTGQQAAYVVAYLRILGYDAYSVLYGANGFMNSKMNEGGAIGHAFTSTEVKNYPLVLGDKPSDVVETAVETTATTTAAKTEAPTKPKKKASGGGGGGC